MHQVNQVICRVDEDRIYTSNGPDANIFGLEPHYGCCTADMHQGWPKFTSHLWMRSADDGLAAVAYAPCRVRTDVGGVPVNVEVDTDYPFDGLVRIVVNAVHPVRFPLHLRVPGWTDGAQLQIDTGSAEAVETGAFHRVEREWSGTTAIILQLSMQARVERRDNDSVAIHRGPLVFALPVGENWRQIGGEVPHADWELLPTTPWNYALDVNMARPDTSITFANRPVASTPFSPRGAPVSATVQGCRLPGWEITHNAAAAVPPSPVESTESTKELRLIPFGATNLRIAQLPVLACT